MVRLDPADLTLAVRSATADLASAEAQAAQAAAAQAAAERVRADLPVGIEMQQIADEVGADALRV